MALSLAFVQSQKALIEARLAEAESFVVSGGSDGTSLTNFDREKLMQQLLTLSAMEDRISGRGRMMMRGRLRLGSC